MFAQRRVDQAHDAFRATTAWTVLLAWPIYLACAALAPQLVGVFGVGYGDGTAVVVILSLTMLFATASGSVDTVLLMSGRSWLSLANAVATVSVNIVLNLILIPRMGIVGAAVSWAVAIVLRNLLALFQVKAFLGISPAGPEVFRSIGAALLCFGPAVALALLAPAGTTAVIAAVGVGAVVYVAIVWLGRREVRLAELIGALRKQRSSQLSRPTAHLGSGQPVGAAGAP